MQQARLAGQQHKEATPSSTAEAQQQAEATNTPQQTPAVQQARQAGQQHKQATSNTTAVAQRQAEATNTSQPAPTMQQARQAGQQHIKASVVEQLALSNLCGKRSAWRGGQRRLCRPIPARPEGSLVLHAPSVHSPWCWWSGNSRRRAVGPCGGAPRTRTRAFLARWTVEPD